MKPGLGIAALVLATSTLALATSLGAGVATLVWKRVKEGGGAASARR
jgi:hypothetical protein